MKKIHVLALSAMVAMGTFAVSCQSGGGATPNASLKTEIDTLSYAYGVNLVESGLGQYLQQMGVVQDTGMFRMGQLQRIKTESDSLKKAQMEKDLPGRIDSLQKANNKNMDMFVKGLQESAGSTNKDKDAYYSGLQIGSQIKMMAENFEKQILVDEEKVNRSALLAGLISSIKKEKPLVENASGIVQMKAMAGQEKAMKKREEEMKAKYADQIAAGDKFMAENKEKEGVVTLESGLQYKVVKQGSGAKPTATDRVKVFYTGSLSNGEEFESNVGKEPAVFGVGQVIKGWTEALQLMPAGSKWILYIPYDLAYGAQDTGKIPPFSNLVFEIELVSVEK